MIYDIWLGLVTVPSLAAGIKTLGSSLTFDKKMDGYFLWRIRVHVTLVGCFVCRHHLVEDEDPGVDIYVDIDTAVRHEHLEQRVRDWCSSF